MKTTSDPSFLFLSLSMSSLCGFRYAMCFPGLVNFFFPPKFPAVYCWGHFAIIIRTTGSGPSTTLVIDRLRGAQNKAHMSQFKWGKLIECHNYSSYVGDCGDRKYNKYMVEEEWVSMDISPSLITKFRRELAGWIATHHGIIFKPCAPIWI